jgi:hypothetical protein
MLNAAWPKMWWQLYDWRLMPTGAFYGTKKACRPLQLIYNYGDHSVYLVNDSPVGCAVHTFPNDDCERKNRPMEKVGTAHPTSAHSAGIRDGWQRQAESAELADGVSHAEGPSANCRLPLPPTVSSLNSGATARPTSLTAEIRVYDIESRLFFAAHLPLAAQGGASQRVFKLPRLENITRTYFLSLRLLDAAGAPAADNFYWLSTKPDVLDYSAKVRPWEYHTPSKGYADLTLLNSLPPAEVDVTHRLETIGEESTITVDLANRSDRIAFLIELLLTDEATGEPIVPIFWQDNYVTLLPNETKALTATFSSTEQPPDLTVRGWNLR